MRTHKNYTDLVGGVALTSVGALAGLYSYQYDLGTLRQMGTGMFPFCLAVLLALVGIVLIAVSLFEQDRELQDGIKIELRDVLCVLLAIFAYGLTVESAGLIISTFISIAICSIPCQLTWLGRLALGAGVAVVCYAIFILGLAMTIPVWPWSI